MAIYIQYKFYEIPPIGYLVMAEDRKSDGQRNVGNLKYPTSSDRRMDGHRQTNIPQPSAGDNNILFLNLQA